MTEIKPFHQWKNELIEADAIKHGFRYYRERDEYPRLYGAYVDKTRKANKPKPMKDKKILIKIQVCGEAGTGKTCISEKLGKILRAEGFSVTLIDDYDNLGYTDADIERNIKIIAPRTDVTIDTVQLRRHITL